MSEFSCWKPYQTDPTAMTSLLCPQQFFTLISPSKSQLVGGRTSRVLLQIRCLNTFLPYPEFERSVECLDNRRLGKQRVEARQILRIVQASPVPVKGTAWANSPAVRMWRGFPDALVVYYNACLNEWGRRGFKNVLLQPLEPQSLPVAVPPWLGDELVHASHRSNLLRKELEHYTQFGWMEPPDLPYVWPVPIVKLEETSTTVVNKTSRKKRKKIVSESAVALVTVVTSDAETAP